MLSPSGFGKGFSCVARKTEGTLARKPGRPRKAMQAGQ
jgi:hypothetical protein